MNTKPRKYGPVKTGKEASAGTNESVFEKFFGDEPAAPDTSVTPVTPPTEVTQVTPVTPVSMVTPVTQDIAPKRDFTRVANSIVRDAVPAGLFTGKGKQLYDYLYSRTRGAIVPTTTVRLAASRVMKAAGMSKPTYKTQLARLIAVGLVSIEEKGSGEHGGNLFTIFLPEEVGNPGNPRSLGNQGYQGNPGYQGNNLGGLPGQESYPGNLGLNVENNDGSAMPKTSFKTFLTDDDIARILLRPLSAAAVDLTGSPLPLDPALWAELGEILALELRKAASKTQVSSIPAFLTAHLKRCFASSESKRGREPITQEKGIDAPESPVAPPNIEESIDLYRTMIADGHTAEQLTEQFSAQFSPDQWEVIIEAVKHGVSRSTDAMSDIQPVPAVGLQE